MHPSKSNGRQVLGRSVLVINRSWIPVHVTTVRRAVCMVYQDVALAVATDSLQTHVFDDWVDLDEVNVSHWVRAPSLRIPAPEVIQLRRYDKIPNQEAPFTRRNLYHRDQHTCQYCARQDSADRLSIDHVLPRSKGGRTTWENCVLACVRCNARKADRTLKDSGLRLIREPRRPRWSPYLNLPSQDRLSSWQRFMSRDQWEVFDQAMGS